MKKLIKLFIKTCVLATLCIGLFKSYGLYKQNILKKGQAKKAVTPKELPFVIIIPAENPSPLAEKALTSVFTQNYTNFRIIYIDDKSTDSSNEQIEALVDFSGKKDKITLISNEFPKGPLESLYQAIQHCEDQELVVIVRASDFLAHEEVLSKLNILYGNSFTWMTYGNYLSYPSYKQIPLNCKEFSKNIILNNSYRSIEIPSLYPLTFYAGLFKKIPKEDFLYNGDFVYTNSPLPYEIPLLEMSGKHARFVNEILYLYNQKVPTVIPPNYLSYLKSLPRHTKLQSLPLNPEKT